MDLHTANARAFILQDIATHHLIQSPPLDKLDEYRKWQDRVIELLTPKVLNGYTVVNHPTLYLGFNSGKTPEEFAAPLLEIADELGGNFEVILD